MPSNKASFFKIIFRSIFRRAEHLVFLLKDKLSERNFIYFACVVVAITCSFAVILLKSFAHNIFLLANDINVFLKLPYINSLLPIAGILLTVFVVRNFLGNHLEKGSSKVLYAVAKKGGILPKKQMYAQIVTSSLTVGLGGSAGLESPIVVTGAAFGSNFAQKYHLSQKDRILLLACGVAAGIGAAFNAPIAGVLFAIEVVLTDITISAFIPIIISAATGALISTVILSRDTLLNFEQTLKFDYHNTPYYILLGILAGLTSIYHARNFQKVEKFFGSFKNKGYRKALFGASILAILIFFFPTLFGEGYESIKTLASKNPGVLLDNTMLEQFKSNEWILLLFVGVTLLLKAFATGLTIGSGGNGGNFAPSLFVGSYLGFFVAKTVNLLNFTHHLPIANFTIVGMAGILSGLFHAPLTAIFLIGEITGGYDLMVPLMIVSSVSFAVSKQFEKHSMDVKSLADKGDVFTSDKDKNILQSIDFYNLVQQNYRTLSLQDTTTEVVSIFATTEQKIIPVLDEHKALLGIIDFDEVKAFIFNPNTVKFMTLSEFISQPKEFILFEDKPEKIMKLFESSKASILPVVHKGKYFGFLSKIDVLESYRHKLREMVID
ncbi:chloride channel protein [Flavobacterium silvisoli]|uniref:Chloride channel protein n=1 Tax=Flavobacterium silvisoli TaxID=2529433 RepID=A0A4Q9Z168_9FLAO|nr:chloride channel protein [Flavobacterium silvisoli]TBX69972.1 chloride channel protein [Flavobacterium silvisoli]